MTEYETKKVFAPNGPQKLSYIDIPISVIPS